MPMGYRQLTEASVADYVAGVPALAARFSSFAEIDVREVGDGNLNYVFIVTSRAAPDETVVVKQAVPFLRIAGESWPLGRQRMAFETAALRRQAELVPGMVPALFHVDPEFWLFAMI
jgi:5-methylthioribose kinase